MDRAPRRRERRGRKPSEASRFDDSRLRFAGLIVLGIKAAAVPLVFDHSADASFVLPKTLLSHGLAYVLAAVLVALLVVNGPRGLTRSPIHVPVAGFMLVSVLATIFAVNPTIALLGTHDRMLGLASIMDLVITFLAAVELISTRRQALALVGAVLLSSLIVISYEAVQITGHDPLKWSIDSAARPFGTIGQPTTLAHYLLILSVVLFSTGVLATQAPSMLRAVLIVYSVVLLLAAGLTGTRSIVIGAAAAAGAFVVLVAARRSSSRLRRLGIVGGVGLAGILGLAILITPIGGRLATTLETPTTTPTNTPTTTPTTDSGYEPAIGQLEVSASERVDIYRMALRMVLERPLFGYGPDSFAVGMPTYRPEAAPLELRQSVTTSPHSWVASVATSTGTVGLIAFGAVLFVAAWEIVRARFDLVGTIGALAVIAYLGAGLTTVGAIETETQFWLALAAIAGSTARARAAVSEQETPRVAAKIRQAPVSTRVVAWAVVAAGVVMLMTGATAWNASRLSHQSVGLRTASTMNMAIELAARATRADGNRAQYWQQLALAFAGASRWSDASNAFQQAERLEPFNIRYATDDIQTQLVLARGDAQALVRAQTLADNVLRIDPNNPRAHVAYAQVAHARRDFPAAVREIDRALELDPGSLNQQLYIEGTNVYIDAGQYEDAVRLSRRGVETFGTGQTSVPVRVILARALHAAGRTTDAVAELSLALLIKPGDPSALQALAQIKGSP